MCTVPTLYLYYLLQNVYTRTHVKYVRVCEASCTTYYMCAPTLVAPTPVASSLLSRPTFDSTHLGPIPRHSPNRPLSSLPMP